MDSELSQSMVGSYLNPPERMHLPSFTQNEAFQNCHPGTPPKMFNSPNNQGNVVNIKLYRKSGAGHGMEVPFL
jgi:centrosomal protein CEP57